tara:strand:+ start:1791 stop:2078 length:288 start_codon:yes stop_codon:yes gene_type:complete
MNYTITQLDRNTSGGVTQAHWTVSKTSGDHTASAYGSCTFTPDPTAEGYVAYDSLTEENVITWVKANIDTTAIEGTLDEELTEKTSPTVLSGTPW